MIGNASILHYLITFFWVTGVISWVASNFFFNSNIRSLIRAKPQITKSPDQFGNYILSSNQKTIFDNPVNIG